VRVKVAKASHDMRFDIPALGAETLENMRRVGRGRAALESRQDTFTRDKKLRTNHEGK